MRTRMTVVTALGLLTGLDVSRYDGSADGALEIVRKVLAKAKK